jgi:hypothetical protein
MLYLMLIITPALLAAHDPFVLANPNRTQME